MSNHPFIGSFNDIVHQSHLTIVQLSFSTDRFILSLTNDLFIRSLNKTLHVNPFTIVEQSFSTIHFFNHLTITFNDPFLRSLNNHFNDPFDDLSSFVSKDLFSRALHFDDRRGSFSVSTIPFKSVSWSFLLLPFYDRSTIFLCDLWTIVSNDPILRSSNDIRQTTFYAIDQRSF